MLPSPLNVPNTALSQTTGDRDFLKDCGSMCNLPTGKNKISIKPHTYIHCVLEKRSLDRNSLNRGQCNFANNSTQRGQYYVISGSKF